MAEFIQTSDNEPNQIVLPFGKGTVNPSSNSASTVLSFSSSTIVSSSSTTTTIGDSVTFDIFETNDGNVPLTFPTVTSDSPLCNPIFVNGDKNNDGILDPYEQWYFTCDVKSTIAGIFEIVLTGFGIAPDGTLVTWPEDPDERIIGTVEVIRDLDSPRMLKQTAVDELSTITINERDGQNKISNAKKAILQSLNDRFWHDDYTLTEHGENVFDYEKKAVRELFKVKSVDVSDIIEILVDVDKTLAQLVIDSVPVDKSDKIVDRLIEKANREMEKAQEHLDDGEPDDAIYHYKKAWMYAQKALDLVMDY